MNILVLNGSPKGKNSITLQTVLYLQKCYPKHSFTVLHVGQRINRYETDFSEAADIIKNAELILFVYPVYTFIVPYQLHRFIELMKEHNIKQDGKFASQISTSKHFYDVTAHKFIEENCYDLGLRYVRGLSADMDDLLAEKGQRQAVDFFDALIFNIENGVYTDKYRTVESKGISNYQASFTEAPKQNGKDVVIVTNCAADDINLQNMIKDFRAVFPHHTREVNLREFPFSGGCLGCFGCSVTGKCVYKDGFDEFLRQKIQNADAIVYAFTIENHYTNSSFKLYDDRQFCNGHRMVTMGMPVGYIISGDYKSESNLQTIVEARCEVGHVYLTHVATDEVDTAAELKKLSMSLTYALEHKPDRPQDFWGVGGTKIFRDLIYIMQGLMKADHKFYKQHGIYDFPQKQRVRILQMKLVGSLMALPSAQKKMKGKMNDYIITPYNKVIESAVQRDEQEHIK